MVLGRTENEGSLNYGQQLVGKSFNPSKNPDVDRLKEIMAKAVNIVRNRTTVSGTIHAKLVEHAEMNILDAQMAAVKAVTWEEKSNGKV